MYKELLLVLASVLVDKFGRPLKNLRIIVTTRCNYRCVYCHSEGVEPENDELLDSRKVFLISRTARALGIDSVKITGGEPLIRSDIENIVESIVEAGITDVSVTTNGFFLVDKASSLAEAGLKRVCVSVPSLNEERYEFVTGVRALKRVLEGLDEAYQHGLTPITINVVVLKFFDLDELRNLIDLASKYEAKIRLIELEPLGLAIDIFSSLHREMKDIIEFLERECSRKYVRNLNFRPIYVLRNGIEIEIVSWFGNPRFCMGCDRVRLTPWLSLKPCIARKEEVSIRHCFELSASERNIVECIKEKFIKVNELRRPFNSYPASTQ